MLRINSILADLLAVSLRRRHSRLIESFCWLLEFSTKEPLGGFKDTDLPLNMEPTLLPAGRIITDHFLASQVGSVCYRIDKRFRLETLCC